DKTGTLTEGKPRLVTLESAGARTPDEVLRLAASAERGSEHPLAAAIVKGAEERGIALSPVSGFQSLTGKGVSAVVDGARIVLGSARYFEELGVDVGPLAARADALRAGGQTVLFVARDGEAVGLLGVADPIRASAREALDALRADGVRLVMLTGDGAA